jgi:hypothetical protein
MKGAPFHSTVGTGGSFDTITVYQSFLQFDGSSVGVQYKSQFYPSLNSELIGGTVNSTSSATYSDNDLELNCNSGCSASFTSTGAQIGSSSNGGLNGSAFVIYPRGLNATERNSFKAAMYATYGIAPQNRAMYIGCCDSRTSGINSTNNVNYPIQLGVLMQKPGLVEDVDNATSHTGWTMVNALSNFYANGGPANFLSLPHDGDAWVLLWDGYNM